MGRGLYFRLVWRLGKEMKLTGFVILSALLLILGYDLWTVIHYGNYDYSVSQFVYQTSKSFLVVPLLTGIVMGHFFWPMAKDGE